MVGFSPFSVLISIISLDWAREYSDFIVLIKLGFLTIHLCAIWKKCKAHNYPRLLEQVHTFISLYESEPRSQPCWTCTQELWVLAIPCFFFSFVFSYVFSVFCELHPPINFCLLFSAGIGRTGCFIATAIGCQQLKEEGVVDALSIVCQLRVDRWVQEDPQITDSEIITKMIW